MPAEIFNAYRVYLAMKMPDGHIARAVASPS